MDDVQAEKHLSAHRAHPERTAKMMAALSSRPIRALILVFVIFLIYCFQPFTAKGQVGNHKTDTSSVSWPHWPSHKDKDTHDNSVESWSTDTMTKTSEGGPRIRQATMIYDTDKFNAVYERSVDSHIRHGKLWNIPTHILRHDIVDAGFFNKPAFLLGLVIEEMAKPYGQRADWIVWFDADTVILNPSVPWSIFLPPADFEDIHVLGSRDQNGFNAGVMLLRVHEWTVKMLAEVIALRQLKPEAEYPFYDQGATKWVLERPGYEEHLLYQPHDWWNAFGLGGEPYNTDRFMLHFAGVDCCGQPEKKNVVMGRWLDIVENHPEKHTVPLANTTYADQATDYWKLLKSGKNSLFKAEKWKDDHEVNPASLAGPYKALTRVIMDNADSSENVTKAIQALDEALKAQDDAEAKLTV